MANEQNLHPIQSVNEAREKGRKGGVASGITRRKKRKMRQILTEALLLPHEDGQSIKDAMAVALINRALKGDVRAFVTIMKFVGETPTELQQIATEDELNLSSWEF